MLMSAAHPARAATLAAATQWGQFEVQLTGAAAMALWMLPAVLIMVGAMKAFGVPRVSAKAETAGRNTAAHGVMKDGWALQDAMNGSSSGQAVQTTHVSDAIGQSTGEIASISADMRSESAFVSGAAEALEASIADALNAITELADAIADAATASSHASVLSARAAELAQLANATITRLNTAIRQIAEIVAFIEKVALQPRQATSDMLIFVNDIIGGADAARRSIQAVNSLIVSMRDETRAIAAEGASRELRLESPGFPLLGAKPTGDQLVLAMGGMADRTDTIADFTGRAAQSAATIREQASTLAMQADQSLADARYLSEIARGSGTLQGAFKRPVESHRS